MGAAGRSLNEFLACNNLKEDDLKTLVGKIPKMNLGNYST